jgi:redox-sensitive bicupin YhaK (pirin superfamily)
MIELRLANDRGYADHGWLKSYHSFSFADYYDPQQVQFGNLRVINEDRVAPGQGFGTHAHRDMEIISYVLEGALAHKDNMGNGSALHPGDVQRMSAGTGVTHSEFNHSQDQVTHFLQIWILPSAKGIAPSYEEKNFTAADKRGRLRLVASSDGRDGSVRMTADAAMYAGLFDGPERANLSLAPGRRAYVQMARGAARINGQLLNAGDGAKITAEPRVEIEQGQQAEILLFDLA